MKKYIGVKIVSAEPMKLGAYNDYRGWIIPADENPEREGYLVSYSDGYVSWCPKEQFEEANREITEMTFGMAVEALKKGLLVARKGWNGKGMFLFMRPAANIPMGYFVNTLVSIPESLRNYFKTHEPSNEDKTVTFTSYICMKAADGTIVNGWLGSQTDILAEDWVIVD